MAHVTTPRWLSPVSRRIVVIVIAAAAAMMLLTSIIVTSASAAGPERVRNVQEPACQDLQVGGDTFKELIPRGDANPNYDERIPLSGRSDVDLPGTVRLTAPPNRSLATFALDQDAINAGVIVLGAVLFNRTDQKDGNLYDYRLEGGATSGTLEPPPRDQGNVKEIVLCFGSKASLSITAALNDIDVPVVPIPVVTNPLVWVFTVTNTGGLDVSAVVVTESDEVVCTAWEVDGVPVDPEGVIQAGQTATCTVERTGDVDDPEVMTTFVVTGKDPSLGDVSAETESIEFYVGLGCFANVRSLTGDKVVEDGPDIWFWVGPVSGLGQPCGTAVEVTADLLDSQIANIVAPEGYPFIGTGIATITWDAIPRDDEPLVRTSQSDAGGAVIEQCAVVIPIVPDEDNRGFFELEFQDALYEAAVDFDGNGSVDGDICLIQQFNYQVAVGSPPVVYMQLQEVFYIWNDPILSRPK